MGGGDRARLVILGAGLLTFGLVFLLLQVGPALLTPASAPAPDVEVVARAADSFEPELAAGLAAVGVPVAGAEPLLRDIEPGDRLDVLASLPSPRDGRPVTAVVVRGATVLRAATGSDALLLEVPSADAMVLAHLVLGGTRLGFAVWPAAGGSPPATRPMDESTARALLDLAVPTSQPPAPAATSAPPGTPTATPPATALVATPLTVGGFIYQVQPGDTWDSLAATFQLSSAELRQWNDAAAAAGLEPGMLLVIPRKGAR